MGSFSWNKADKLTKIENIAEGAPFKFLIPKCFGGGFIKDHYQDYGYLGKKPNGKPKYDMYEILAFWNKDQVDVLEQQYRSYGLKDHTGLRYNENTCLDMPEISEHTDYNRGLGIDIGCYNDQIDKLKYPLKLVSASYKGTYEDCPDPSYNDPDQGFYPRKRK